MLRTRSVSVVLVGALCVACNAIFGLDEVSVRDDADGAAGAGTGGNAGGSAGSGAGGGAGGAPDGGAGTTSGGSSGIAGAATGGAAGTATGGTGGVLADMLIDVGEVHACAALNGTIKCWGENNEGQLNGSPSTNGIGDAPGEMGAALAAVDLGGASITDIATGDQHTCAVTKQGGVRCWGSPYNGALGFGTRTVDVDLGTGESVKEIDAGGFYTCARLVSGGFKCWGANALFQLGQTHTETIGDDGGEMGDALPPVNFGSASLLGFAAGYDFACARLSAATSPQVRCWGSHDEGQLGFTPTASMVSLANTTTILNATPLLAIGAGRTHACVIHANESMSCWGVNYYGELGLGVGGSPHPTPTAVQLGSFKAKAIALGMNHTCAIVDKTSEPRSIKCWGHNDKGQLGINSMQSLGNTPNGMGNALQSVILPGGFVPMRIAAGGDTTCAASETGQVLCWGSNTLGHLGQGRTDASIGNTAGSMQTLVPIDLGWP